jgi:hypothetical protein
VGPRSGVELNPPKIDLLPEQNPSKTPRVILTLPIGHCGLPQSDFNIVTEETM